MFKHNKPIVAAAFCLAAICLLAAPAVYGDDWDKATRITVNHPFEVPGAVLPAGTYIIKILDLAADRHVVRILSEDETKVYATVLGIPNFSLEPTEKTALTFYESPNYGPLPVHSWFYPNHQFGIEFAYPEKRATEIAAVSEQPVVAFKPPEPEPVFREEPTPEPAQLLFEYVVESTKIVDPQDVVHLRDIGRPTLPLVTCYPFYYVGPAPKRFVVHAAVVRAPAL
jgi:hypothetical protein